MQIPCPPNIWRGQRDSDFITTRQSIFFSLMLVNMIAYLYIDGPSAGYLPRTIHLRLLYWTTWNKGGDWYAREEAESATLGLCYEDEYDDQWTMDRIDRFGKNKFVTRPTVLLEGRSRLDWKLLTYSLTYLLRTPKSITRYCRSSNRRASSFVCWAGLLSW